MMVGRRRLLTWIAPVGVGSWHVRAVAGLRSMPELIAQCKPSVVLVGTYSELDSPRFAFRGSGFVVGDGRTVLTNAHVLPEVMPSEPDVQLVVQVWDQVHGWSSRRAKIARIDRRHDLAALSVDGAVLPTLEIAGESVPLEGTEIALIGFPVGGVLGFSHVTHRGIVSAVTRMALPAASSQSLDVRAIRSLRLGDDVLLQLDATAYPGNSGGPVIDVSTGEVIGMVSLVLVKATRESALTQPTGITYAIPASNLRGLLVG